MQFSCDVGNGEELEYLGPWSRALQTDSLQCESPGKPLCGTHHWYQRTMVMVTGHSSLCKDRLYQSGSIQENQAMLSMLEKSQYKERVIQLLETHMWKNDINSGS